MADVLVGRFNGRRSPKTRRAKIPKRLTGPPQRFEAQVLPTYIA